MTDCLLPMSRRHTMSNPVIAEATRGDRVESAHRGAGAVVDASGTIAMAFGDIARPGYPRSAAKALQALPLIEGGAADSLGLSDKEIALACASHSGDDDHVATAREMLAKAARDENALECGAHWPLGEAASRALARSGAMPSALHNNCSGKHAGFVCLACAGGVDPKAYVAPDHPIQREVTGAIADVTQASLTEETRGVDGCSIPTYAISLGKLALGFARFATGLGLAVKADDGGTRAAQVAIAALIERFGGFDDGLAARLAPFVKPRPLNWNGVETGVLRPAGPLA